MKKISLKKILVSIISLVILIAVTGCGKANYSMSGGPNKTTIKINAEDGKYGEGFVLDISKNEIINIDAQQLEKGELKIEFFEVWNTATGDEPEDYEILSTIKTVNVKPGDNIDLPLDYSGEFMPGLTAVGDTSGTLIISIVKQ